MHHPCLIEGAMFMPDKRGTYQPVFDPVSKLNSSNIPPVVPFKL